MISQVAGITATCLCFVLLTQGIRMDLYDQLPVFFPNQFCVCAIPQAQDPVCFLFCQFDHHLKRHVMRL